MRVSPAVGETMRAAYPHIAILGIHLESNAFAPVTTGDDCRAACYLEGEAMLVEAAKPCPARSGPWIWTRSGHRHV